MRTGRRVAAGVFVVLAGCGWDDVEPRWVEVEPQLLFVTSCAEDVRATVTETADVVRIDDIGGDPVEGDCLGGFPLVLEDPIGDRLVIVEDEPWPLLSSPECRDVAYFAPPDVELSPDCFPQG